MQLVLALPHDLDVGLDLVRALDEPVVLADVLAEAVDLRGQRGNLAREHARVALLTLDGLHAHLEL